MTLMSISQMTRTTNSMNRERIQREGVYPGKHAKEKDFPASTTKDRLFPPRPDTPESVNTARRSRRQK